MNTDRVNYIKALAAGTFEVWVRDSALNPIRVQIVKLGRVRFDTRTGTRITLDQLRGENLRQA